MKQTLLIAAALVTCSLLSACGSNADSGVDVRPPAPEAEQVPPPSAMDGMTNK